MSKLGLSDVIKSYNAIKKIVELNFKKRNIDKVIDYVDVLASLAAMFNWIFKDNEIEKLLEKIANESVKKNYTNFVPNHKKIVFYDQIGTSNCLALQYIRGLISADYEIFYIFESSSRRCSSNLINELKQYPNSKMLIIDSSKKDKIKQIIDVYNEILQFQPSKAILHSPAEGAFGVILWNALSHIVRFRIVPGDHHFYLGLSCSDYFFEFRRWGYTTAILKRDIDKNKIIIQPYYPIIDNNKFYGLPEQSKDKIIIFSAGSFYKTYGENDIYFCVLKKILQAHPQVIIYFAGGGFDVPFKKYIKSNGFQDRIILLGYRNDLNMCIANSDIYLTTFPFTGGLTTQYAAYYSIPILSYTTQNLSINLIEDILGGNRLKVEDKVTFTDLNIFFEYANELIIDRKFRLSEGLRMSKMLIKKEIFNKNLISALENKNNEISFKEMVIDYSKSVDLYLNIENKYIPSLRFVLLEKFRLKFFFIFPWLLISTLFSKLFLSYFLNKAYINYKKH